MNNSSANDLLNFDFYIFAPPESVAAQEIKQILQDAAYSAYLPERGTSETDIEAASGSKRLVLLLTNDGEQTKRSIADFLNIMASGDQRPAIIIQIHECDIADLLDRNLIIDLSGLRDPQDCKRPILAAVEDRPRSSRSDRSLMALPSKPIDDLSLRVESRGESLSDVTEAFSAPSFREIAAESDDSLSSPQPEASPKDVRVEPRKVVNPIEAPLRAPYIARREASERKDIVEFGVSHPTEIALGVAFIIDALIYRQTDRGLAIERAVELNPENDRFRSAGATEVARGTKLSVQLELPWPTDPAVQVIHWNGLIANVSFRVLPNKGLLPRLVHGCCKVSVDGLTIGQVFFRLEVGQNATSDGRRMSSAQAIKSAFASYASPDRRRVLARVQGIEKLGVSVFLDTHSLRANEEYKKRLFQAIDASDILYLFWSRHAKRSNWVAQEWRYGLQKKGLGFIDPVPLADPRRVTPPVELADHKHFNDWRR